MQYLEFCVMKAAVWPYFIILITELSESKCEGSIYNWALEFQYNSIELVFKLELYHDRKYNYANPGELLTNIWSTEFTRRMSRQTLSAKRWVMRDFKN